MIQRIQTLFLLGAAVFLAFMLFMPLAEILTADGVYHTVESGGLKTESGEVLVPTLPVLILILVTALLLLINIFLFRKRKLQIRLCVYSIVLCFGLIGLLYYYWVVMFRQINVEHYWLRIPVVFPVVAIILIYLAFRGIRRDEILVRSIEKIR